MSSEVQLVGQVLFHALWDVIRRQHPILRISATSRPTSRLIRSRRCRPNYAMRLQVLVINMILHVFQEALRSVDTWRTNSLGLLPTHFLLGLLDVLRKIDERVQVFLGLHGLLVFLVHGLLKVVDLTLNVLVKVKG